MSILRAFNRIPFNYNNYIFNPLKLSTIMNLQRKRPITTLSPGHHSHSTPTISKEKQERPMSPHLTIYQPQLTWLMSIGHRVTGTGIAGVVYGFGMTSSLTSSSQYELTNKICEMIGMMPLWMVLMGKFVLAVPFMYHLLNGIRHLIWDTGRALTLKGVYVTGWIVNAITLISATILTII